MKLTGGRVFAADHRMYDQDLCFENGVITETSDQGELAVGYRADIVVFDPNFQVKAVFLKGKQVV